LVLYIRILRPKGEKSLFSCSCLERLAEKGVEKARGLNSGAEKVSVGKDKSVSVPV